MLLLCITCLGSYKCMSKCSTIHRKKIDCGITTIYSLHVKDVTKNVTHECDNGNEIFIVCRSHH